MMAQRSKAEGWTVPVSICRICDADSDPLDVPSESCGHDLKERGIVYVPVVPVSEANRSAKARAVLVTLDDWQTLYVNGRKAIENHRLTAKQVCEAAGFELETRALDGTEFEREVSQSGITPELLSEVPSASDKAR